MKNSNFRSPWPEWSIQEPPLGQGSYAAVYKAVRRDIGSESYAAIKVIHIPLNLSEINSLRSQGLDSNSIKKYLKGIADKFINEIQVMEALKGIQNIVSVEDYKVIENPDELGWTIYIRMELLTPFTSYLCDHKLSEAEVIKIAQDLCTALEICKKRNIIHRDIKPENIFVNNFGFFKLGDFGIARTAENMTGSMSQAGTHEYMAPEVTLSSEYTAQVDIYSLGIVLYRLLNNNKLPFLDTEEQVLNPTERQKAIQRRISGEPLPPPCNSSREMADVILRACAFKPSDRFESPTDMKQALQQVANSSYVLHDSPHQGTIQEIQPENQVISEPITAKTESPVSSRSLKVSKHLPFNIKKRWLIGIAALIAGIIMATSIHSFQFNSAKNSFFSAVEMADYDTAVQILNDHQNLVDHDDIITAVIELISTICTNYRDNNLEYDIAKSNLEGIASLKLDGISSQLTESFACINQLNESRTHFETAESLFALKNYKEAISHYYCVIEEDYNYDTARNRLSKAKSGFREVALNDAALMAEKHQYTNAITLLNDVLTFFPKDMEIVTQIEEYQQNRELRQKCNDTLNEARFLADSKAYVNAMDMLKELIDEGISDERLHAEYEKCREAYITETLDQINLLIENNDFYEASKIAKQKLDVLPDCQEFKDIIKVLENAIYAARSDPSQKPWEDGHGKAKYDENGNLQWYHIYDFDQNGTKIRITSYDASGKQTSSTELQYDEKGRLILSYGYKSGTGTLYKVGLEHNENGDPSKTISYTENGSIDSYSIYEYGPDGNLTQEFFYNADDTLNYYILFSYEMNDNKISKERMEYRDADGSCFLILESEYDSNSFTIRKNEYDGNGNLETYEVYEENRVVTYNADGTIISIEYS